MPTFVIEKTARLLKERGKTNGSPASVMVLGVTYKKDVADMRESSALEVVKRLASGGYKVSYHDPHVPELPKYELVSQPLEPGDYDCVTIVTAHGSIDYKRLVEDAKLVVDFRNATGRNGRVDGKVWKL